MIIAQISDTHIALDTLDAEQRMSDFECTIADINALHPPPAVIIHTGDVVHNGRSDEYAEAVRVLGKAQAPVYVIPGNKDDRTNLRAAFSEFGYLSRDSAFIDYSVEDYAVRLIAVDTLNTESNKGDFCADRTGRLIKMINAEGSKPIAVLAHHPPFEVKVGPDPINFETTEMMELLQQALRHSGRVIAVFSGHVHRSTAGHVDGIPAMVAPCIATTLRKGEYPPHMKNRPVYYVHRFDPAWGFITEARIVGMGPSAASRREEGPTRRTNVEPRVNHVTPLLQNADKACHCS
jgi:3',5'-cyclic AMP phosphodiesterase CpdA